MNSLLKFARTSLAMSSTMLATMVHVLQRAATELAQARARQHSKLSSEGSVQGLANDITWTLQKDLALEPPISRT
jgi:hypothetical protein